MIDPSSPHPRFYQLYEDLRGRIMAGEFVPLQAIPSQQQLMEYYGVSLITVRRALERLTAEGYITREHGRGCFVTPDSYWLSQKQRSPLIGIIVSSIPNSFFPEIITGVETYLEEKKANLMIAHSRWQADVEQSQISCFLDQGCAGLLISPSQHSSSYRALLATGVPFVFINHYHQDHPEFLFVVTDDRAGASLAGEHLMELGHGKVGAVIGGRGKLTAIEREEGLRTALLKEGRQLPADYVIHTETFTYEEGMTGMGVLLSRHPDLTAVFCSSEMLAVGAAGHLMNQGKKVPEDVSLVAFGDSDTSRFHQIPLTTIRQPTHEMGRRAMQLLWETMRGRNDGPCQQRLQCRLVVRESTGPAAG